MNGTVDAQRQRRWYGLAAFLLAAGAAVAVGWTLWMNLGQSQPAPAPPPKAVAAKAAPVSKKAPPSPPAIVLPPAPPATIEARLAAIEARLSRIREDSEAAAANAGQAETLLIAFAARRALDRGMPLGYIETELARRFGGQQPAAVAAIRAASADPVTLEELRARLGDLEPKLISGTASGGGFWSGLSRELSELFVLRSEGQPSPAASQRFERAQRLIDAGQVDGAVAVVEGLSGRQLAAGWLMDARRYAEARRALDLIETAALLAPQSNSNEPASPAAGSAD